MLEEPEPTIDHIFNIFAVVRPSRPEETIGPVGSNKVKEGDYRKSERAVIVTW